MTRDPVDYDGGINLYGYVGNDPANEIDPDGLAKVIYNRKDGTITVYDDNGKKVVGPFLAGDPGIVRSGTYGIGSVDWLCNPVTKKPTRSGSQKLHDLSGPDPKGRTRAAAMGDVAIFLNIPNHVYRIHHARNPKKTHGCIGSTNQKAVDDTGSALDAGHGNTITIK